MCDNRHACVITGTRVCVDERAKRWEEKRIDGHGPDHGGHRAPDRREKRGPSVPDDPCLGLGHHFDMLLVLLHTTTPGPAC